MAYWRKDNTNPPETYLAASVTFQFACMDSQSATLFVQWANSELSPASFTLVGVDGEGCEGDAPLATIRLESRLTELFNVFSGIFQPLYEDQKLPWLELVDLETLMVTGCSSDYLVPMVSGWIEQFCNFYDMACVYRDSQETHEKLLEAVDTQNETIEMLLTALNELRGRVDNYDGMFTSPESPEQKVKLLSDNDLVTIGSIPTIKE